jgi:hypothetical protein
MNINILHMPMNISLIIYRRNTFVRNIYERFWIVDGSPIFRMCKDIIKALKHIRIPKKNKVLNLKKYYCIY